ncbi:fungal zn(2)-Cys(6) binuclear cluster domain-containing protein [Purpureocillium lilacinum]|uniref:Fungal zn(2)-Cys(6) binuclear cluster domain-containing protein n=1 Tax=Purpureocillium lilacinum TaxID=33203 RepID=A0A179H898_PURLI|nr:fungal zn(2)-Cys(6) binuclear cluster domain-containing protein [Purpureocillium lilacinum]OAQ85850.1 fungal zn(2)-Cys(6) binuclear cluster domain-containing protein [Purpureocillium lilacinum]
MPTAMTQACLRCKQQKRKCDRLLPVCSLCQRLNRSCCYSDPDGAAHPLPVPDLLDLTPANISQTLEAQVSAIIGPPPLVHAAAQAYFTTVHPWLPVISEDAYYSQLSASRTQPMQADFGLLTLSMYLVCALPVDGQVPAQTRSLYALLRSFVVWRGVVIANRYATLLSGKGSCPPPKPSSEADEKSAEIHDHTTPSQIDHFTRLAHASRLLEQVLAHIHETTPHHEFNTAEAFQIIKTATCFMETFSDGDAAENAILSSAMAVCRSAVMEILEFGSRVVQPDSEFCNQASVNMLKTIVEELMHGAAHLLSASSAVRTDALSVFIAQPLYKAAMIYLRNLTDADRMDLGPSVKPLRDALLLIGKRWAAAGRYIEEIDRYARQN